MRCTYGTLEFRNKAMACKYFQSLLKVFGRIENCDAITALIDLIHNHPRSDEKIGVGIDYFSVRQSPSNFGGSCFYITRLDGSHTDFSMKNCMTATTAKTQVMRVMRRAVDDDIAHAKKTYFENHAIDGYVTCPITQRRLDWASCHADHAQPTTFEVICKSFVLAHGFEWDTFPLEHGDQSVTKLPVWLLEQFCLYHKKIARIRIIAASQNRKIAYAHRIQEKSEGYVEL